MEILSTIFRAFTQEHVFSHDRIGEMTYPKSKSKLIALLLVVLIAVVASYLIFNKPSKSQKQTTPSRQQSAQQARTNPKITKPASVGTADFEYQKPAGWAKLDSTTLASSGAVSGISRATGPAAQFTVKVSA